MADHRKKPVWREFPYPENLMYDIMVEDLAADNPGHRLTSGQIDVLQAAMASLSEVEYQVVIKRYREFKVFRVIGEEIDLPAGKCQQICSKALWKLHNPIYTKRYRNPQEMN